MRRSDGGKNAAAAARWRWDVAAATPPPTQRHRAVVLEGLAHLSAAAHQDFARVSGAAMAAKDKRYFLTAFSVLANEAEKQRTLMLAAARTSSVAVHGPPQVAWLAAVLDTYGCLYRLEAQYNKCLRRYVDAVAAASRQNRSDGGFFHSLGAFLCFRCC